MNKLPALRALLIQHAIVWSAVSVVASGLLDRALIPADEAKSYCEVPTAPEQTRVSTLADLCVGREEADTDHGLRYHLLPEWDETACANASPPRGRYSRMAMIPAGSQMDVVHVWPRFSMNMGTGNVGSTTYLYDAGELQPWTMTIPAGYGGHVRLGSLAAARPPSLQDGSPGAQPPNCSPLFRFINRLDERPGDWTIFYSVTRAILADWKSL